MTCAVGFEQGRPGERLVETLENKTAGMTDRNRPVAFTESVMIEARENVALFDRRTEPLVEAMLRTVMHDEVSSRDQQLGRDGDRPCIGNDPLGCVVQLQQDIDRNWTRNQWIGLVGRDALGIVRDELWFDVGIDEKMSSYGVHELEPNARKGHIEFHFECWRCEHQAANSRRIVVRPDCGEHRPDALRHHRHALYRDAVLGGDMVGEGLHVAHGSAEARTKTTRTRREPVPARIPGKHGELGQIELVYNMRHAAGVLVAAVEEQDGASWRARSWRAGNGRPVAIEQRYAIMGLECPLLHGAHADYRDRAGSPDNRKISLQPIMLSPQPRAGRRAHD